jgi:predicted metal-dependent hydrolase
MYPKAYLDFLIYFHSDRDYFECHEVLEEHWKEQPQKYRHSHWVGLIQIAVGLYHHRRGNINGAWRMYDKAISIIGKEQKAISELGLDVSKLLEQLKAQQLLLKKPPHTFFDLDLPITDDQLLQECIERCLQLGKEWCTQKQVPETLIHKHSLRDRNEIVKERARQLTIRTQKKKEENDKRGH